MAHEKRRVIVQKVGLRDGLQSVPGIMRTSEKKRRIDAEYAAGVRHMEVASFVPARHVALADTTGHATPGQVDRFFGTLMPLVEDKLTVAHFHDTRGLALVNTMVALQHGVYEFDATLAGLGGCPHAPGASGNVAIEDLVFMLESMGYETGIDTLRSCLSAARSLKKRFRQRPYMDPSGAQACPRVI
jgi:isopropylmalate/homocitrate/citramalate synthase